MITRPQAELLARGLRFKNVYPLTAPVAAMARRMAAEGLVEDIGYLPTLAGLEALRQVRAIRWARHGCAAYLDDLKAVEAEIEAAKAAR